MNQLFGLLLALVAGAWISLANAQTDKANPCCPAPFVAPSGVPGINPVISTVDSSLPIISTNPLRIVKASAKSRYPIPASHAPPMCQVVQVQILARHGTRNPTNGDVKTHVALQAKFKATPPTNAQFAWLANFTIPASAATQGLLTTQGAQDHIGLANRIKANYPTLVSSVNLTSWKATNSSRVLASGSTFADALFAADPVAATIAKTNLRAAVAPQTLDAELRPFDACAAYVNASDAAKATNPQDQTYANATFPTIAQRVGSLVGSNLTVADVTAMFSLCGFENTLQGKIDGFCSLFTDDELAQYDFMQDLSNDINEGYALEINKILTCSLITTFVQNMDAMAAQVSSGCPAGAAPTAVFRFAHEETIAPMVVALGLFGGTPSNPAWTQEQIAARPFRYSEVSPFAANLILELHSCNGIMMVRLLHNEVPIVIPGCTVVDCPLEVFKMVVADKVGCDFDGKVCGNKNGTIGSAATYKNVGDAPLALLQAAAK